MKRFRFQLEPVLNFKQQRLDVLLIELESVQGQVRAQEKACAAAAQRLRDLDGEYEEEKALGMTVSKAIEYQSAQEVLESRLRRETERLKVLRVQAEEKREQVVEARKETRTLEKLRDIRRKEYDASVQKAEEKNIDDLTAAKRHAANMELAAG